MRISETRALIYTDPTTHLSVMRPGLLAVMTAKLSLAAALAGGATGLVGNQVLGHYSSDSKEVSENTGNHEVHYLSDGTKAIGASTARAAASIACLGMFSGNDEAFRTSPYNIASALVPEEGCMGEITEQRKGEMNSGTYDVVKLFNRIGNSRQFTGLAIQRAMQQTGDAQTLGSGR